MKNFMLAMMVASATLIGSVNTHAAEMSLRANFVPYMVTDPALCPDPGLVTKNKDVRGLIMLLNRQMIEMSTGASAQVPELTVPDQGRILDYIDELEAYQAQINQSSPSDYPGTHSLYYCLAQIQEPPVVSSQAVNDLLTLWTLTSGELATSASANLPADLREPDNERLSQHVQAMRDYIAYLDASRVQDYPRTNVLTRRLEEGAGVARNSAGK